MKKMKRLLAICLALVMCMGMTVTAFAQEVPSKPDATGPASITINKASKGETYTVHKIFDAIQTTAGDESVFSYIYTKNEGKLPEEYTVEVPDGDGTKTVTRTNEFFKIQDGMVFPLAAAYKSGELPGTGVVAELSDGAIEYLKYLASDENYSTTIGAYTAETAPLKITGLEYGYYLVTSTLNTGSAVSVNSANPNAVMNEKNTSEPDWTPDPDDPTKKGKMVTTFDGTDYEEELDAKIGDVVKFRLRVTTQNYNEDGKLIVSYTFKDNVLDKNFKDVNVVSVKVFDKDGKEVTPAPEYTDADSTFPITVEWVNADNESIYESNSILEIVYTAELKDTAVIDGAGNVNSATFSYTAVDPEDPDNPDKIFTSEEKTDTATVFTYALAFEKINTIGEMLANAEFELPFSVIPDASVEAGNVYIRVKADTEGAVNVVTTKDDGIIIVKGVDLTEYEITETKSPTGYNKVDGVIKVQAVKTGKTTTETTLTRIVDANGNVVEESSDTTITTTFESNPIPVGAYTVVVNRAGNLLPSTGGIGTTIFYVVGGVLVAAAGILLITKKRMSKEQ